MKPTGKKKPIEAPVFDAEGYQVNMTSLNGEPLPELNTTGWVPFHHGGARKGAGRKPTGRQPVLLRLTAATVRALRAAARSQGKTLSAVAEEKLARIS